MRNLKIAGCVVLISILNLNFAQAAITVRDITLKGNNTEVLLDSNIEKSSVQIDFVRDIVQFSINNATIYPAKMLHAEQAAFTKVFAYQYSPTLVRVRFSVENKADQFKNKIKWSIDGKKLLIQFTAPVVTAANPEEHEKKLLQKITASEKETVKEVKEGKIEVTSESHPLNLTGTAKKPIKLAGAKSGPSAFRSFLAMFLVVGGLGLILIYVKRKKSGGIQAKKASGNSWFSNLLPQNRKQKPMMEVIATHVLGPKQSIVVMKIRGQQFVLAVTAENIQLITQLDADEAELDLLDDPKVAASIGRMFGVGKATNAPVIAPAVNENFNSLLKNSTGAGAIIARNAYASQAPEVSAPTTVKPGISSSGARDLIRRRLEGLQ